MASGAKKSGPKRGDHVTWSTSQGETEGVVERVVTSTTKIKGYTAKASPENPQLLVKSDKTGKVAVHKPHSLTKKSS